MGGMTIQRHVRSIQTQGLFESSNLNPGDSYTHQFNATSAFPYYCSISSTDSRGATRGKTNGTRRWMVET